MGTILVIGIIWHTENTKQIQRQILDETLHSLPRDILAPSRDSLDCAGRNNRG